MLKLILILIFPVTARAEWLCEMASSIRSGQTITACGVGVAPNENAARTLSRESAIEEFKRVCNISLDCKQYDYVVVPKRTECKTRGDNFICYRALDFEITEVKRKSVELDTDELQSDLDQKSRELQSIQSRIQKIQQIKRSERAAQAERQELARLEASMNQKESEILKLQDLNSKETIESGGYKYLHQTYTNSLKVSFHFWSSKIAPQEEDSVMWLAAYERRPLSWLGLQAYGGFGAGKIGNQKSDTDVPTMGAKNSTQRFDGKISFVDVGVSALVYSGWGGVYLKNELGVSKGSSDSYEVSYNNTGVGEPHKSSKVFSAAYYGASLGFDTRDDQRGWGLFFEVGGRKVFDQDRIGFIGGSGINYGF